METFHSQNLIFVDIRSAIEQGGIPAMRMKHPWTAADFDTGHQAIAHTTAVETKKGGTKHRHQPGLRLR